MSRLQPLPHVAVAIVAFVGACGSAGFARGGAGAAAKAITFEADVRPILKAYCFQCHGEGEKLKGDLDVRLRRTIVAGGESGTAIVPGDAEESLLYQQVRDGEMPKGKKKLTAAEIDVIEQWIAGGAKTAHPEPTAELKPGFHITDEERSYWAFQPIRRPQVPTVQHQDRVRTPIDALLLRRLEEQGMSFSEDADKPTLIRRATYDLTGLPPTPEEVEAFLADTAADAYDRLIDRLLASPHYGEHWGRHWLDVAGYADSDGYVDSDPVRKYAWKYRDYVIRAFNADKPFDQFIREQLAGDEMLKPPYKNLSAEQVDKLVATGFLRMAPDGTGAGAEDQTTARNAVIADELKVVSTSLLGLSVGCAQCHDHRFDPIAQEDYYRLRAIFEPAYDWKNWRAPQARLVSLYTDADRAAAAKVEAEAAKIDAKRKAKDDELTEEIFQKELAKVPEEQRDEVREARSAPKEKRTAEQTKLLKEYPAVLVPPGSISLYDPKAAAELQKLADEAGAIRAKKPVEEFVQALTEVPGKVPATHVFGRGDPEQPKQAVAPGEIRVLCAADACTVPEKDSSLPTTGRRLAYAKHLTDGKHPLVARVLMNRVWMHEFGRGIVASPGDFGRQGELPTNPKLLDWLAEEFMARGWSLKAMQKLILTSTAYRQSSGRDEKAATIDPDDRLCLRMAVRRIEAETVRDAVLAVSGRLNAKMFGPPVPVAEDESGQTILAMDGRDGDGRPKPVPVTNGDEFRRSVYVQVRRSRPLGMLEAFDAPTMTPNCEARNCSTVTPQSLMLMNSDFVMQEAKTMAKRVAREAEPKDRVRRAWRLAYGRDPSEVETKQAAEFLERQVKYYASLPPPATQPAPAKGKAAPPPPQKPDPQIEALSDLCHALLSSNAFLYVD
jgi:mono/diheme cytochrome c family protein